MEITKLRHAYPEPAGMVIDRKNGYHEYTFLHFFNRVKLLVGGKVIETEPNAVIIYDTGTAQYFLSEVPLTHDWMHFKGDISYFLKLSGLSLDTVYYPVQSEFITAIIKEMETEFYGTAPNRDALLSHKFSELFIKLGRAVSGEISPVFDKETKNKFRYLRGEILSDLAKKWSVADMAKAVNLSQSRFFSIYKSIYGISPTADLIGARIERAKKLLLMTNKKVCEISDELGYDNTTHFIRQFKNETGLSPSQYRRQQ